MWLHVATFLRAALYSERVRAIHRFPADACRPRLPSAACSHEKAKVDKGRGLVIFLIRIRHIIDVAKSGNIQDRDRELLCRSLLKDAVGKPSIHCGRER